jgi:hypothetical protein
VDETVADKILPKLGQGTYEGKSFNVTVSKDQDGAGSYGGRSKGGKKDYKKAYKKDYKKGSRKRY